MEPKPLYSLPLFLSSVEAGFPSPADEYLEGMLDLNKLMVKHPAATFFVRAAGDSMIGAAIHPGDILMIDRAEEAVSGKIILAVVNGEFTVKRFIKKGARVYLTPENPRYPVIEITEGSDFQVWGVVTWVIHKSG
jgi:DNA polymerase V